MLHQYNRVEDLNIAYIGGGSKNWAWTLMCDLAQEPKLSGRVRLYDIDMKSACENCDVGNGFLTRPDAPGKWRYEVAPTMEEALAGADFVVMSILPGTFGEMRSDVHLPERYGIYQSVGDTVGPAGLLRALRTIPIYAGFAEKIKEYAPRAWVINYTNPMTLCTRTLYEVFPGIKAFGCCHGVFETRHFLAHILMLKLGLDRVDESDIKMNVLGVNHFTWIDKASYRGTDILPLYMEFAAEHAESGYEDDGPWDESAFKNANRVGMDVSMRCGVIAASPDRHFAEFLPPWYLKDPDTVRSWKFHLTSVDLRIEMGRKREQYRQRVLSGEERIAFSPSGEEAVRQMKALLGLEDFVTNVNLPNRGQMEGVPAGCVVETNAWLTGHGVSPVLAGRLPDDVQNLVMRHVLNQETILQAALKKDRELAFRAFLNDPLVTIGIREARELFEGMLQNTKAYLPGWDIR